MSKGGSTSSATEIPAWLENAAIKNINRADDVSQIGYTPYYGPDVAAFSPMQQQAMQATGGAASAFGLAPQGFDAMAGMPQAQEFAGGIQGYSSAPLYEQSLQALQQNRPAQYEAITGMFIDPITGEMTGRDYRPTVEQVLQSNYAQGGDVGSTVSAINQAPDYIPATDGGTGYWQGGDQTATQTNDLSDEEFEAYVLAHGLPENTYTTGDALRGIGGNLLDSSLIGRVYEGLTGDPLAGGSPNAPVTELSNADAFPIGSDYSAPRPAGDWGYDDDYSDPNLWDFSQATAPTAQVETAGGLLEQDLQASLAAEEAEMSRQAHEARMAKAKAKAEADAKADKEAKAKAEAAKKSARAKAEEAIQRQLAEEEAFNKAEAKKAQVRAKQAADAKAAKAKAKAEAKKRAEYLAAEEAKKAKAKAEADAKAKAKAEADRKAKLAADRKAKLAENERINAEAKRVADALEKQTRELAAKKAAEIKAKQAADAKAAKAKAKAEAKKRADYLAAQRAEQAPAPAPKPYKRYSQANALAAKNGYAGVSGGGGR